MKKIITGLMILSSTQFALGAASPVTTIKDMYVYPTYIVMKIANKVNTNSCNTKDYMFLSTTGDGGKQLYSAALSAYVAGKKVRFGFSGCYKWGTKLVPKGYGISLRK